jgi:hypothetical protein
MAGSLKKPAICVAGGVVVINLFLWGLSPGQKLTLLDAEDRVASKFTEFTNGVAKGQFKGIDLTLITEDFHTFQTALAKVRLSGNDLAPSNLISEGDDVLALIALDESGK